MKFKYLDKVVKIFFLLSIMLANGGCKKFIEVDTPVTSVSSKNVYNNDNTAISVLTGMYENMIANILGDGSIMAVSLLAELSADNLTLFDKTNLAYLSLYQNDLKGTISEQNPSILWTVSYQQIFVANAAIEGVSASTSLTPSIKQQLLGEAHFMRAFYFFYLVNLYGDVPLVLETAYQSNALMGRTSVNEVYTQIITDLKEAQSLLSDNYLDVLYLHTSVDRIRINKAAATAMLARAYLYTQDWANAETEATKVIDNNAYALVGLDSVFLKNSKETIWSLQPTQNQVNTWEGYYFILDDAGPFYNKPFYLSEQFIDSFEVSDQRLVHWTGNVTADNTLYYYPYKYKVGTGASSVTEYEMVMRIAEQYLIRAEARAQQGNLTGTNSAASDLNAIRTRAGLPPTTASSQSDFLNAILHERQMELFTEWGNRWFDLKRTGRINDVMSVICPLKGGTWEPYKALYPILQSEIDKNPAMKGHQNPGYIN